MQVSFQLTLPHDEASVPITRKLISHALEVIGVDPETIYDVEVALSEACSNVLRHTGPDEMYEVRAGFDATRAFLEIIDQGAGMDTTSGFPQAADDAESGRGVVLMTALMDSVRFESRRGDGHSVFMEKVLTFLPEAPARRFQGPPQA